MPTSCAANGVTIGFTVNGQPITGTVIAGGIVVTLVLPPFDVVSVTRADALRVGQAYARWGRGAHRAGLNYGDCFAYALAKERACSLLYVGKDFARTDIASVL